MSLSDEELLQVSQAIRERVTAGKSSRYRGLADMLDPMIECVKRLHSLRRRLRLCASRQRFVAATKVVAQLCDNLRILSYDTSKLSVAANCADLRTPSAAELIADLQQAQREFDGLRYDQQQKLLAASVGPIELESVYLGEFEIRLKLTLANQEDHETAFEVAALDPHPSASDETVTHPHVRDRVLCAGDGATAIRSALAQGRICDFFLLVKSVLCNYNSSSPYVALTEWEGEPCYDCGTRMSCDDLCCCSDCQHEFCSECLTCCIRCDRDYCLECLVECPGCLERVCEGCLVVCPNCKRKLCKECFNNDQCPCKYEKENDHEDHDLQADVVQTTSAG